MLVSKTFVHEEVDGDNKIKSGLGINSAREASGYEDDFEKFLEPR